MGTQKSTRNRRHKKAPTKKVNKGLVFYVLDFFKSTGRQIANIFNADIFYDKRKRAVFIYSVLIFILAIVVFTLTKKNAYDVYVGETLVCSITYNKETTEESITNLALAKLKTDAGTDVKLNEQLILKKANAKKADIIKDTDAAIAKIYKTFTYQIQASEIYIDGNYITILKNESEASQVLNDVQKNYESENAINPTHEFINDVSFMNKFINISDADAPDKAKELLLADSEVTDIYVVKSGDNLSQIAARANITTDELLAINPNITINSPLKIAQELNIKTRKPVLSVTSSEDVTHTEPLEYEIETKPKDTEGTKYKIIVQQGKKGEEEITERITKINGIEQSREVIKREPTIPSIPEIVEVGTKASE